MNDHIARLLVLVLALGAGMDLLRAQEIRRGESVENRARPELDPLGVRTGGFLWYPEVGLGLEFNDNIFANPDNDPDAPVVDDWITVVKPKIVVESDWSRHRLAAGADADVGRYQDFNKAEWDPVLGETVSTDEDYEDWWVWTDGRLDLGRSRLSAELRAGNRHNFRYNANDRGNNAGVNPTTYDVTKAQAAWLVKPARVFFRVDGDFETRNYDSNMRFNDNGTLVTFSNEERDRDRATGGLRAGFDVTPDYDLFVEGRVQDVSYDVKVDPTCGCERSYDGWSVVGGSSMDFSGDTFGEVFVGYRENTYDDPQFGKQDGPTYGLNLTWNVTRLTSLKFSGEQTVAPTTIAGSSGIDQASLGVRADHELLRNLLLNARLGWRNDDFQNLDRDDEVAVFGIGGEYMFNRYFDLSFGYNFRTSDTSPDGSGGLIYDINTVFVEIKAQL